MHDRAYLEEDNMLVVDCRLRSSDIAVLALLDQRQLSPPFYS